MIIPINLPAHTTKSSNKFPPQLAKLGTEEVVLIELQGAFQVEGDKSGQLAARINVENDAKPTLRIGHHLLEGKMVNLPKPLAVLVKKTANGSQPHSENLDTDAMDVEGMSRAEGDSKADGMCEYDMLAVVKRKVLFSKRPMPMVNMASIAAVSTDASAKP
ncbi:hypothetical protein DFH11DRAFT_1699199 [Phellopilus nigrolimitatus]|nr:hypothetical protein DFH11DRAFT_1699199 [Phellopilus nigrolimitatus]